MRGLWSAVILAMFVAGCGSATDGSDVAAINTSVAVAPSTSDSAPASTSRTPDASPTTTEGVRWGDELPFGLRRCGVYRTIEAGPSYYRDEPIYIANEQPSEEIRAWAALKPGFQELWIDRNRLGWIAVGFTEGAAERQAELESEFPDIGVVAVEVPYSNDELLALREELAALLVDEPSWGMSGQAAYGIVEVGLPVLTEERLAAFADYADQPVCFEGLDPADAVLEGPQLSEGHGWRLLAVDRTGPSYRTGVATNDAQLARLWSESGVSVDVPVVDFETEIVIWFGAVYGSGCEIRMDDVVVDPEAAVVHGEFVVPTNVGMCHKDANSEAYLVAVDRSILPVGPFAVQLRPEDPPRGAPEERTLVHVDLSAPGVVATDEQLGPDPELFDRAVQPMQVGPGSILPPNFTGRMLLPLDCDLSLLGPFNGVMWAAENDQLVDTPPSAWLEAGQGVSVGYVESTVDLVTDPNRLLVTANEHTEVYVPSSDRTDSDC